MVEQLHVFVSGQVQGVGYRQATCNEAVRLGLTGWVRNLSDGRVEAVFIGPRDLQETMLAWCKVGPDFSNVTSIEADFEDVTEKLNRFEIRF